MQTMELVRTEDVFPLERPDGAHMNPRDFSTRESERYVEQLGEQFRRNRLNPGQPRLRPILYRDGGIYWIVDGECRWRAMRLIGTREFWADVYDDLGDAELARQEAAKAMVETDAKLALTPIELSRGVQAMLDLGVADADVAAAARMDEGGVRRARRARRAVGDAAEDMTLDRLIAIADLGDDEEAVARLRDCPESSWRSVYEGIVEAREEARRRDEVLAALSSAGVAVAGGRPDGTDLVGTVWLGRGGAKDPAAVAVAKASAESATAAVVTGASVYLYAPAEGRGDEGDDGQDEFAREWEGMVSGLGRWVAERLGEPARMPMTAHELACAALAACDDFALENDVDLEEERTPLVLAVGWSLVRWPHWRDAWLVASGRKSWLDGGRVSRALGVADSAEQDGWEPGGEARRALDALSDWLADHREGGR